MYYHHHGQTVKVKLDRVFPDRYSWECPKCGSWNQSFERTCPTCEYEEYRKANPVVVVTCTK